MIFPILLHWEDPNFDWKTIYRQDHVNRFMRRDFREKQGVDHQSIPWEEMVQRRIKRIVNYKFWEQYLAKKKLQGEKPFFLFFLLRHIVHAVRIQRFGNGNGVGFDLHQSASLSLLIHLNGRSPQGRRRRHCYWSGGCGVGENQNKDFIGPKTLNLVREVEIIPTLRFLLWLNNNLERERVIAWNIH